MVSQNFAPQITLPTRKDISRGSLTIIDNIFFRSPPSSYLPVQNISSRILVDKISDHFACVAGFNVQNKLFELPKYVYKRNFSESNISNFTDSLEAQNIPAQIGPGLERNPEETYNIFHEHLTKIRDQHIPLKKRDFSGQSTKLPRG